MKNRKICWRLALCSLLWMFSAHAEQPGAKYLKLYETIQPSGVTPFGENVNLYTGELNFQQTDIELAGQGPTIVLGRDYSDPSILTLADWSLTIPRIEVMVKTPGRRVTGTPGENWKTAYYPVANGLPVASEARCTHFGMPYDPYEDWIWWQRGYELTTERGERHQLLKRSAQNMAAPNYLNSNGMPMSFPVVTQQNWQIGCLPKTSNGQIGEAFLAISPDGNRYYFDHLVGVRTTDYLEHDMGEIIYHGRMLAVMYVSKIEDRFGNFINYRYTDDKLVAIESSDGRAVAVNWQADGIHRIESIVVQPGTQNARTWQYRYGSYGLAEVVLPDLSKWTFVLTAGYQPPSITNTCGTRSVQSVVGPEVDLTISSPTGAIGVFTLSAANHARSYVPSDCRTSSDGSYAEDIFPIFGTSSLVRRQIKGPGLPTRIWNYIYSPAIGSTTKDACALSNSCVDRRWVDVIDPEGNRSRYSLSTRWGVLEGKMIGREDYKAGVAAVERLEALEYAPYNGGPYPLSLGGGYGDWRSNTIKSEVWSPLSKRVITQQGVAFKWEVATGCSGGSGLCFDTFARPIKVIKSSSPSP